MSSTTPPDAIQAKVKWSRGDLGPNSPEWAVDPDIQNIVRTVKQILGLSDSSQQSGGGQERESQRVENVLLIDNDKQTYHDDQLSISFLAQGGFNKLYTVIVNSALGELSQVTQDGDNRTFVLRIALPVDPIYKTLSEVATTNYVRERIGIPIPKIYAYECSTSTERESPASAEAPTKCNEIGFEWILMECMRGQQLRGLWHSLEWRVKENLADVLAGWCLGMFRLRAGKIGNLFRRDDLEKLPIVYGQGVETINQREYAVDRMVTMGFFWDKRLRLEGISRGPYASARDWLTARLNLMNADTLEQIRDPINDEDVVEDIQTIRDMVEAAEANIDYFFPAGEAAEDSYALFHDDISSQNLLLDSSTGEVTALLDWECVSFVPLFKAASFPHVLQGRDRTDKPEPEIYGKDEETGQPGEFYLQELKEWEQTQLRKRFLKTMEDLPGGQEWLAIFNDEGQTKKRDFEQAVHECEGCNLFAAHRIIQWFKDCRMQAPGTKYGSIPVRQVMVNPQC